MKTFKRMNKIRIWKNKMNQAKSQMNLEALKIHKMWPVKEKRNKRELKPKSQKPKKSIQDKFYKKKEMDMVQFIYNFNNNTMKYNYYWKKKAILYCFLYASYHI